MCLLEEFLTQGQIMLIGYARVSTEEQSLDMQIDYLKSVGCTTIYQEKFTGRSKERPELKKAFNKLKKGDTLVCSKLDRLGRSMKDLISLVDQIKAKGCHFKTSDGIDTSTHMGVFIFHIFGALAEMEVGMIRERTMLGLKAARARGRVGGRPKGITKQVLDKSEWILDAYKKGLPIEDILAQGGVSLGTLYAIIRNAGIPKRNVKLVNCEA